MDMANNCIIIFIVLGSFLLAVVYHFDLIHEILQEYFHFDNLYGLFGQHINNRELYILVKL